MNLVKNTMKNRQIIITVIAGIIIMIGLYGKNYVAAQKEKNKPEPKENIITVFAETVENKDQNTTVETTGSLIAKNRIELYSEVQGLMLSDNGRFRPGSSFSKGQTLISLRSNDAKASVTAQRSNFEKSISSVMSDIKLDFPNDFIAWNAYLENFDVFSSLENLPEVQDSKLKSFLTGRGIYNSYFTVRNAEINLQKYQIRAPFSGVLTSSNVDPGTVIRPGQLLGVFIQPGVYELKGSTDIATSERLKKGQVVEVSLESEPEKLFTGTIIRVNPSIDPETQLIDFFIELKSNELHEGQFMQINVDSEKIENALRLNRSAIQNSKYAFVVEANVLKQVEIEILHTSANSVIIRGLNNGQKVLTKLPPSVFEGMKVKIFTEE